MKKIKLIGLVITLLIVSGCSSRKNYSPMPTINEEAKKEIAAPVNCSTADRDIAVLEEEKASVGKQMLSGVRSLMPISVVAGILLGDYGDRVKVATGKYNRDIKAKISEIKEDCGIN